MGFDQAAQLTPWDHGLHLAEEALTPRLLMMSLKTDACECQLAHGNLAKRLNQITSDLPRSDDLIRGSLIRFEYEMLLSADQVKRMQSEVLHRGFWSALLTGDPSHSRVHFTQMANDLAAIGLDILVLDSIDATIMDNLSEMILVRSNTQKTRSRSELKMLMQLAVLKGEVSGWWHTHH